MNTESTAATPSAWPGHTLICTECGTAQDLVVESISALDTASEALVNVEYSCGECEWFYAHEVPAAGLVEFRAGLGIAA